MFWESERIKRQIKQLEKERDELVTGSLHLESEVRKLNREVERLKSKKKIEEEEIKHLVKIASEKKDIEFMKKEINIKRQADDAVYQVREEYQIKLENSLKKQINDTKEMYAQILKRLPNVNVKLNGDV